MSEKQAELAERHPPNCGARGGRAAAGDTTACRPRAPRPPLLLAAAQRAVPRAPLPLAVPAPRRRRRLRAELGAAGGQGGRGGGRRRLLGPRAGVPGRRRRRGRAAGVRVQRLLRRARLLAPHAQLHRRRRQVNVLSPFRVLAVAMGVGLFPSVHRREPSRVP
ncbi:hypothetical protein GQ55_5G180500 [Panicum hallii var. hallii]|uniref:Uncharacterized protein n=1 Tax=Panicum hallii var. hallii TaxID=1504633 RepID=A0A2T7DHH1_9POAL|nr:hypothetical protein GQ55_5G180500 [Panicum hallii var. hallii]